MPEGDFGILDEAINHEEGVIDQDNTSKGAIDANP